MKKRDKSFIIILTVTVAMFVVTGVVGNTIQQTWSTTANDVGSFVVQETAEEGMVTWGQATQAVADLITDVSYVALLPQFKNTDGNMGADKLSYLGYLDTRGYLDVFPTDSVISKYALAQLFHNVLWRENVVPKHYLYILSYTDKMDIREEYIEAVVSMDILNIFNDFGQTFNGSNGVSQEDFEYAVNRVRGCIDGNVISDLVDEEYLMSLEYEEMLEEDLDLDSWSMRLDEMFEDEDAWVDIQNELGVREEREPVRGSVAIFENPTNLFELYANIESIEPFVPGEEKWHIPEYISTWQGLISYDLLHGEAVVPDLITTAILPSGVAVDVSFYEGEETWVYLTSPIIRSLGRKSVGYASELYTSAIKNGKAYGFCTGSGLGENSISATLDTILNADYLTQIFYKSDVDGIKADLQSSFDKVLVLYRIPEELKAVVRSFL